MKKYSKFFLVLALAIVSFTSCNSDDVETTSPSNDPLTGMVNGLEFRAIGGKAFDRGEGEMSVNITNVETTCADSVLDYDLEVSFIVPNTTGRYDGANLNVVFSADGETPRNLIGSSVIEINSIRINSAEGGTLSGKVIATWDDNNTVNGTFTVDYCE